MSSYLLALPVAGPSLGEIAHQEHEEQPETHPESGG